MLVSYNLLLSSTSGALEQSKNLSVYELEAEGDNGWSGAGGVLCGRDYTGVLSPGPHHVQSAEVRQHWLSL